MLRNIPNRFSRETVLNKLLDSGSAGASIPVHADGFGSSVQHWIHLHQFHFNFRVIDFYSMYHDIRGQSVRNAARCPSHASRENGVDEPI